MASGRSGRRREFSAPQAPKTVLRPRPCPQSLLYEVASTPAGTNNSNAILYALLGAGFVTAGGCGRVLSVCVWGGALDADARHWLLAHPFHRLLSDVATAGSDVLTSRPTRTRPGLSYLFAPAQTLGALFGVAPAAVAPGAALLWQLVGVGVATVTAGACYALKARGGGGAGWVHTRVCRVLRDALLQARTD